MTFKTIKQNITFRIVALFFVLFFVLFCGFYQFFASMGGAGCLGAMSQVTFFKNSSFSDFAFVFILGYFLLNLLKNIYSKKDGNIFSRSINFLILAFWVSLYKVFFSLFYAIKQGKLSPQIYNKHFQLFNY